MWILQYPVMFRKSGAGPKLHPIQFAFMAEFIQKGLRAFKEGGGERGQILQPPPPFLSQTFL